MSVPITSHDANGALVLRFTEAKLTRGGSWIAEEITRNLADARLVALDFGAVEFINSECVGAVMLGVRTLQKAGTHFAFFPGQRRLKKSFCPNCFSGVAWFDDESAAVKHLSGNI